MTRHWLHTCESVAAALVMNPPDIDGWDLASAVHHDGSHAVHFTLVDDDGAVATFTLAVTGLDLDERRVKPEPREHEGRQR